jgi:hypothetical protein
MKPRRIEINGASTPAANDRLDAPTAEREAA